ncbi:MAG TPA: phosphotransferase family protein [Acidimicrobiales bacterium]
MTAATVDDLAGPLTAWLADRLGASDVSIAGLERPAAGQSNDTILCDAIADGQAQHLVVRRQAGGTAIFRRPDVLREARVLQGLAASRVPVPAVRWTESDASVLGAPFFVMERVSGRVPLGKPSIHTVGWLPELTAGERDRLWASALDVLIAVHEVDWRATHVFLLDNDPSGSSLEASVAALTEWYRWSAAGREFPITDAAAEHLIRGAAGLETDEPVLLWGDPRVGNMIFRDDHSVAAAIDWETATVGCAERDVAHWLFFDEFQTDAVSIARLPGWPDRDTTISRYEARSGRRLRDLAFFDIMDEFFMATTLIRQADARVARGLAPETTRMGHDNTVTQMLARRLGLPVPELSPDYLAHRGVAVPRRTT